MPSCERLALLVVLFVAPLAAACAPAAPRAQTSFALMPARRSAIAAGIERVDEDIFYTLEGSDLASIDAHRRMVGPPNDEGGRSYAYTYTHLAYRYDDDASPDGCRPTNVQLTLTVTTTMPRWVNERTGLPHERQEWARFYRSLALHESNHAAIGVRSITSFADVLSRALEPSGCPALHAFVDAAFASTIEDLRTAHRNYDLSTRGGITEGAWLSY